MTVYIEIVFIENFAVDYFLLLAGERISRVKCKYPIISAVLGASYATLIPLLPWLSGFWQKAAVLIFMCALCYGIKNLKELLMATSSVSVFSAALSGIIGLFAEADFFYVCDVFFLLPLCSALLSALFYRALVPIMHVKRLNDHSATVTVGGVEIKALIDSGNTLYYKNSPVVLVDKSRFKGIRQEISPLVIPYTAVGVCGALIGFKPDKVYLSYMEKTVEIDCVVALCDRGFSGGYGALVHPDVIKECV